MTYLRHVTSRNLTLSIAKWVAREPCCTSRPISISLSMHNSFSHLARSFRALLGRRDRGIVTERFDVTAEVCRPDVEILIAEMVEAQIVHVIPAA